MCRETAKIMDAIWRVIGVACLCLAACGCSGSEIRLVEDDELASKKVSGSAGSDTVSIAHVVVANNNFGFDLYRVLADDPARSNLFFSPYSIESALTMALEGARGDTAEEMGRTLRIPESLRQVAADAESPPWLTQPIHEGFAAVNATLTSADLEQERGVRDKIARLREQFDAAKRNVLELQRTGEWQALRETREVEQAAAEALNVALAQVDQYELRIANSLWGEKTYPFKPDFVATIDRYYGTQGVNVADFKTDFPGERSRMNQWVEQHTNARIKDLIPALPPEEARFLRLVLINAIYFKGEWSEPFDVTETSEQPFHLADGDMLDIPLMRNRALEYGRYVAMNADGSAFDTPQEMNIGQTEGLYPDSAGFAILELPYKGGELAMLLISPNDPGGLAAIEQSITGSTLEEWTAALQNRETHVLLPRFELEESFELKAALKNLGMVQAFEPRFADFSNMTTSVDPKDRLYVSKVVHKAFLEVTEKGTEAAAATGVMMASPTSVPQTVPFTPVFRADRPFLFLIRDNRTGVVLFIGRFSDPRAAAS